MKSLAQCERLFVRTLVDIGAYFIRNYYTKEIADGSMKELLKGYDKACKKLETAKLRKQKTTTVYLAVVIKETHQETAENIAHRMAQYSYEETAKNPGEKQVKSVETVYI